MSGHLANPTGDTDAKGESLHHRSEKKATFRGAILRTLCHLWHVPKNLGSRRATDCKSKVPDHGEDGLIVDE